MTDGKIGKYRIIESVRPKLVGHFANGLVRSRVAMKTSLAVIPAGSVFFVRRSGISADLEGIPCDCCGVSLRLVLKGARKFDDFEWIGYGKLEVGAC